MEENRWLTKREWMIVLAFSFIVFGYALIGGRVLTMHESRLPQASREMMETGDWLIPRCGGRPWLERPPLPHWMTVGVASLFGRCDEVWIVRIPNVLVGIACVAGISWLTARFWGRGLGLMSGLILTTLFEFTRYAWLAEEDIYVALSVLAPLLLFVHLEFPVKREESTVLRPKSRTESSAFLGSRPWMMGLFFLLLGATNLVKGLMFGTALVLIPILGFIAWDRNWARLARYTWLWGWLLAGVVALAWVVAAALQYPDMVNLWLQDIGNRTDGVRWNDPIWYYWLNLTWGLVPWTPFALVGLYEIWPKARSERGSIERFLLVWSVLPIMVLSIPTHKHHHYIVPCLAPWAILSAIGARSYWQNLNRFPNWWRNRWITASIVGVPMAIAMFLIGDKLPGPAFLPWMVSALVPACVALITWGLNQQDPVRAALPAFSIIGTAYLAMYSYTGLYLDKYLGDTRFLELVQETVPAEEPVYVNAAGANLNMFRHLFYLGDNARLLHNLTFLRDQEIDQQEVFVITRQFDQELLEDFGDVEIIATSDFHQRRDPVESRWTLFRLRFRPDLERFPSDEVQYTALQVLEREEGPFLGRPF